MVGHRAGDARRVAEGFADADLRKNFDAFVDAIVKAKPSGAKGKYLRKISLSSTMGPGVKVDMAEVTGAA